MTVIPLDMVQTMIWIQLYLLQSSRYNSLDLDGGVQFSWYIQTSSKAHSAPVQRVQGPFPDSKAVGAWRRSTFPF